VSIAVGIIFFAGDAVLLLVDSRYHESIGIITPIVVGYLFLFYYSVYSNYLFYLKKTILVSINTLIATTVNIAANYYFISRYGYVAAAYTTLVSFFLLFLLNYITAKIKYKYNIISLRQIFPGILIVGLSVVVSEFIGEMDHLYFRLPLKVLYMLSLLLILFYRTIKSRVSAN